MDGYGRTNCFVLRLTKFSFVSSFNLRSLVSQHVEDMVNGNHAKLMDSLLGLKIICVADGIDFLHVCGVVRNVYEL